MITSDYGEHLGENGYMGHATTLYRPVVEVHLVMRGPGIPVGDRVDARVGLRDLPATVLHLVGVHDDRIPGRSLAFVRNGGADVDAAFAQLGRGRRIPARYPNAVHDLRSVLTRKLHYIVSSSGAEELFRIADDPR